MNIKGFVKVLVKVMSSWGCCKILLYALMLLWCCVIPTFYILFMNDIELKPIHESNLMFECDALVKRMLDLVVK